MRLQTTITEEMNTQIEKACKVIGCSKNDFVRFALTQYMLSIEQTQTVLKDYVEKITKEGGAM